MSAALLAIGVGTQVASTLMQGWMADYESRAEQRLAERNATIEEMNATARLLKGRFDGQRAAQAGEATLGRLSAGLGASGARTDVGAPMALLAEQAGELELEGILIDYDAQTEARQFRDRAAMLRFGGKAARRRGKNARRASLINAFGEGVKTFGTAKREGFLGGAGGLENRPASGTLRSRVIGRRGKSIGSLRGRAVTRKGGFAGTNKSSASPFGTVTA